jgi:hypothetical protein
MARPRKTQTTMQAPDAGSLPAHAKENPDMLSGQALRDLAHRRGLAKSQLAAMSDEKIREQLRYATYRQYDDDAVV